MPEAKICGTCEQLLMEPDHLQILCSDFSLSTTDRHTLLYRRELGELRANATRGCPLCSKLVTWFKLDTDIWKGFQLGLSDEYPESVVFALCIANIAPLILSISLKAAAENMGDSNWLAFELLTSSDDPAAQYFPGRLANQDVGSEKSFLLAKQWMQQCEFSHPNCPRQRHSRLPKRVLDLYPDDPSATLILSITDGSFGRYACLSYWWGLTMQRTQLTTSNLASYLGGISLQLLPQSIQDAIFTARRLGFRYLWIDSLCIIQDSPEDKAREIERMDQVYSNADLTISAANADDCALGFLAKRNGLESDAPIRLPFLCPDWTVGNLTLVMYNNPTRHEPLYSRSWPFQEHLLSARVLIYGSEQMLWVCQQDSSTGTGATFKDGGPAYDPSVTGLKYMRMFLYRRDIISRGFARKNLWIDLVIEYSSRKQSIPDDKIHALQGIASRYSKLMEDKYIAGLWQSWLLPGLMWKRSGDAQVQRQRQYPSWSWLSIDGAVSMEKADDAIYKAESVVNIQLVQFTPDATGKPINPFGLLPNAILHLRGHVVKIERPDWEEMRLFSGDPLQRETNFLQPRPARMVLDSLEALGLDSGSEGIDSPVWCLPIIRARVVDQRIDRYIGFVVQGILLLKQSTVNYFRRVGWFISNVGNDVRFLGGSRQDVFLR
ncbi:MAG: hypothetical protein Q9219_004096 [cf. Caloplaca sp. 3 TL-2023]